jgi:hypothetical protein
MGDADFLSLGDWNAVCFRCGKKAKASTLRREWEGFYVCESCWEPRHPQEFVRGVQDVQTVPWSQPENWTAIPLPGLACFLHISIAGYALAGCARAGVVF